jgi:putative peptidoglycan lipid II flippase
MALIRSIATIGGLTATSRVLGFVRDVLVAAFLGAGIVADAYIVALRLPNLFRSLFAEGAFSAAFVPTYVSTLTEKGRGEAWRFAREAGTFLALILLAFVIAAEAAMPWVIIWMAPGFTDGETFDLAVTFSQITFPYLLFMSMTALFAGILNSHDRFAAAAATPILLNLCMIAALLALGPLFPTYGHALAWGLAIAGVVQCVWLYCHCAALGYWFRFTIPRPSPEVRTLLRRVIPVAFGAGVYQINILVGTILASLLPSGSVAYLFYADRVGQLPFGIIAVAVGTALLPTLTRQLSKGQSDDAMDTMNRVLEFAFLLMLPAAAALVVASDPIIAVLFERGAFGPTEVAATAPALALFALGLPALLVVKALSPAFFARGDTKTPVMAALVAAIANIGCSIVLMQFMLHLGIALASSISMWLYAGLLSIILWRRGQLIIDQRLARRFPRTLAATLGMAAAVYATNIGVEPWLAGEFGLRIAALVILVAVGVLTFCVLAHVFNAARLQEVRGMMTRKGSA